jgi:hypothetical protein
MRVKRIIAGCAYRTPEPNDPADLRKPPTDHVNLRAWQVCQICPLLIGLPIRVNHATDGVIVAPVDVRHPNGTYTRQGEKMSLPKSVISGGLPLGTITYAWVDRSTYSLHWIGKIEYESEITPTDFTGPLLHQLIQDNKYPYCSLQHYPMTGATFAVPVEISICHVPRRPSTLVRWKEEQIPEYMRNTNITDYIVAMSDPAADATAPFGDVVAAGAAAAKEVRTCMHSL